MLHALAAAAWVPAAPGKQALWCGARQLRPGTAWLPLRPRLCPSPQMQAGSAREVSTGGAAAAAADALVDELSEVVATHARSPLTLGELHRSLQTLTAKAAATLESAAAEPAGAPPRSASVAAARTVAELKAELKARGLPTSGVKVRTALAVRRKGRSEHRHHCLLPPPTSACLLAAYCLITSLLTAHCRCYLRTYRSPQGRADRAPRRRRALRGGRYYLRGRSVAGRGGTSCVRVKVDA